MITKNKRIFALLLALVMVFGIIAPTASFADGGDGAENNIIKELEEVKAGDKVIKGTFKDDFTEGEDLTFEIFSYNQDGKREKTSFIKFEKTSSNSEPISQAYKISDDRKSFELEYSSFDFKKGEKYAIVAKQGEDRESDIEFEIKAEEVTLKVNIENNGINLGTSDDPKKVTASFTVNGKAVDAGKEVKVNKGEEVKIEFSLPDKITGYSVKAKYADVATNNAVTMSSNTFTIPEDKVTKDLDLKFIIVKDSIPSDVNLIGQAGETYAYGILDKSTKGMKYYGFKADDTNRSLLDKSGEIVFDTGIIIFTSDKFTIGEKINYYLIDDKGFYSQLGVLTASYRNIIKELEEVKAGDKVIKGTFEDGFAEETDLTFEIFRYDEDGNREETSFIKFEKTSLATGSTRHAYKISEDKKSFELDYSLFNFKEGEKYAIVAKQGEDWKSDIVFEIKDGKKTIEKLERIKGKDRYITALEIAKKTHPKTDTVILASGVSTVDALAAGPLANILNAPILLAQKDSVDPQVSEYLKTAGVKNVIIVGGEVAVSNSVENSFASNYTVERIKGVDRFETSVKVAERLIDKHGFSKETVLLANGITQVDALSAARLAEVNREAIILTPDNSKVASLDTFFTNKGIKKAKVIGGEGAISKGTLAHYNLTEAERYSGSDRFATSLDIAKKGLKDLDSVILANGTTMVDALTAASLAKEENGTILLVRDTLTTETAIADNPKIKYIFEEGIKNVFIVGGEAVIGENIFDYLNLR